MAAMTLHCLFSDSELSPYLLVKHPGAQELLHVIEGNLTVEIEGKGSTLLKAGEAGIIPAELVHLQRHQARGELHHVGLGRKLMGTRVLVLVDGLRVRVITEDGELVRELVLDPTRDYQPHGRG